MRLIATPTFRAASAVLFLGFLLPAVLAHGGDENMDMGDSMDSMAIDGDEPSPGAEYPPSYFTHPEHRGVLVAHIGFMVLAWVVVLPLATMFSLTRSRYTLPTQFIFIAINALGVLFSTIYNANTPDLYPNNAHHKLGWLVTWVLSVQVLVSLLGRVAGAFNKKKDGDHAGADAMERRSFIPVSHAAMDEHHRLHSGHYSPLCRHSNDSGQGTEPNTESLRSASFSSTPEPLSSPTAEPRHKEYAEDEDDLEADLPSTPRAGVLRNLATKIGAKISVRAWKVLMFGYNFVDRTSMILGFITLCTGIITMGRFFEGRQVFTGLAHWIKGGIFFWLGVLTLGRWAGCFGELGWAWNIRPKSASKRWIPSAEFTESFLIFFYGSTNIFLEHLGNWGGEYSFEDLEHISITVLFLGGGLCGMLIESDRIRELLNTTVASTIDERYSDAHERELALEEPTTYRFSMNPIPALVILLLGIMMSSHTQESMISSMVHKQWGTMLTGASFARGLTYVITYLKPPTSILPSRPPTELLAAFGLMTGGILFMASSGDTVEGMIHYNLDVMFMYTVTMGLVGLLMAWEIIVIAVKGWAARKEAGKPVGVRFYSA
ncbi:hypothetical protein M406DRAFT_293326 [Cryphonectria parasitica EP155]|uniref:Integral membrane protein n=1 Tax=Cryphonectria parasitica (strain ATCC 38755 / EP155) TaxID=660469 RepID=A0A9P5CM31_CRYP1|nr:uncharacterized protein M406DRAFT_293326 [Cryphonectria parasitica EP155]KAF3763698.1 hypothetical protein M406DRAFT_293326 [Cryphonectria parasitica EP155]